jgi:hypothetical protein
MHMHAIHLAHVQGQTRKRSILQCYDSSPSRESAHLGTRKGLKGDLAVGDAIVRHHHEGSDSRRTSVSTNREAGMGERGKSPCKNKKKKKRSKVMLTMDSFKNCNNRSNRYALCPLLVLAVL